MKKLVSLLVVALVLVVSAVPAFAHGHHGGQKSQAKYTYSQTGYAYTVCNVQSCTLTGIHAHDGKNYYGHHNGDGHVYHGYGHYGHGYRYEAGLCPYYPSIQN